MRPFVVSRYRPSRYRMSGPDLLTSPLRRVILAHVARHPGVSTGGLVRALQITYKQADHHAAMLARRGLLQVRYAGRSRTYAVPGPLRGAAMVPEPQETRLTRRSQAAVRRLPKP